MKSDEIKEDDRDQAVRDTAKHIRSVQSKLNQIIITLTVRLINHDSSKYSKDEWPYFAVATKRLRGLTYGSEEYKASLKSIQPAIDHHNKVNRHHPEFHKNGINDMNMIDILEMMADWKAATERHEDGDFVKSMAINRKRFMIPDGIYTLMENTAKELGWM